MCKIWPFWIQNSNLAQSLTILRGRQATRPHLLETLGNQGNLNYHEYKLSVISDLPTLYVDLVNNVMIM